MSATPNLALPLLAAAQAQKHVTHNEALLAVDALLHLAVLDRDLTDPPAGPAEGERFIVAAGASGVWAGHAGEVAAFQDGGWAFYPPKPGWIAFVVDEGVLVSHDGTAWSSGLITALQNLTLLGLGTTADAANPFSAKLNTALWTAKSVAEGGSGDLRYTLNKESASHVLSLLFQSAYAGRAEIGLTGDDDLHVKVSADGAAWTEAIRIDRATGTVALPAGASVPSLNGGPLAGLRNRIVNGAFRINQRGHASGAALAAGAFGHDRWKAGAGGCTYTFAPGADTTVTITAGTLVQVIEDRNIEGGTYTLSWTGTAQGRVNGGAYATSPVTVTGLAAGAAVTVEFSTGTLGRVQFEPGTAATLFERRPIAAEMLLCQRYFWRSSPPLPLRGVASGTTTAGIFRAGAPLPVRMRADPTVVLTDTLPVFDGASATTATLAVSYCTKDVAEFDLNVAAALTAGRPALVYQNGTGILDFSAEI